MMAQYSRERTPVATPGGGVTTTEVSVWRQDDDDGTGPGPAAQLRARRQRDHESFVNGTQNAQDQALERARAERDFRSNEPAPGMPTQGRGPSPDFVDAESIARPSGMGYTDAEAMLRAHRANQPRDAAVLPDAVARAKARMLDEARRRFEES